MPRGRCATTRKFWLKRLHPEDSAGQGGGSLEYRFRHREGHHIWIQDTFSVTHDDEGKPKEIVGSWADVSDRKRVEAELKHLAEQVELRNRFIRETFGRYLTDEVVSTVLESPSGLKMGGEKRKISMIMTDLRGFTSLSERLPPQRVVALLNRYSIMPMRRSQSENEKLGRSRNVSRRTKRWRQRR